MFQSCKTGLILNSGDLKSKHLKSRLFEGRFSNGWAVVIVPTIWKLDHSKFGCFCLDFKWFLTKWRPFVWISNGWEILFQIPFEIGTICNPTSFWPFEIQTNPDFRSLLYTNYQCIWMSIFKIMSCHYFQIWLIEATEKVSIRFENWKKIYKNCIHEIS